MSIALASAWRPRGELARFQRLAPKIWEVCTGMVITLPPDIDGEIYRTLQSGEGLSLERYEEQSLWVGVTKDWSIGRHLALQKALDLPGTHIQYVDFDHLLRWIETRPDEWLKSLVLIQEADCVVFGRTQKAYATYPQAIRRTEAISNRVASFFLEQEMDVSAGSKGFSRAAAEYLAANSIPGGAFGADAEWPVLLHRAGFRVDYLEVDGLDWEIPDRYQTHAAGQDDQMNAIIEYDADQQNWIWRAQVAEEIVNSALAAAERVL